MASTVAANVITTASYLERIVATVKEYKRARDNIEEVYNQTPGFPDTSLSTVGESLSDEESLEKKRQLYEWSTKGEFPPHLKDIPAADDVPNIFDPSRLAVIKGELLQGEKLKREQLKGFRQFFTPLGEEAPTMDFIEERYRDLHETATAYGKEGVCAEPNVGLRGDWYTDAVFAQQHLTGVNPTGLKQASEAWISAFAREALDQKNTQAHQIISTYPSSFYVVDNSDYRYILGLNPDALLMNPGPDFGHGIPKGDPAFGCASVTLFTLSDCGKLHPVAICLDYKGSLKASVTIFNHRLTPFADTHGEHEDWPWRAAKMCTQVSDWLRHELVIHLTETHLVEEATIVGVQRNFPDSHIICQLLHPHWDKTLSLNLLARRTLVPALIKNVAPLELPQIKDFVKQSYMNFDFTGRYAPNDLKARGFDPAKLDDKKFHNYLYARNIYKCWDVLRSFVSDVLTAEYPKGDSQVLADKYVAGFCAEMRSQQGGQLPSFPIVKTLEELIDMVTMCIQIASPQHNAINYLQQYYLSFVPNRPAALAAPLPSTLAELKSYTEAHIIDFLPLKGTDADDCAWMIMAEIPYLLSSEVDSNSNIETYADGTQDSGNESIAKAGVAFSKNIRDLKALFDKYNKEMDDHCTPYYVLDPNVIAKSILI
ncbi:hypothetical protein NMY22_g16933 [Coprinellus aureogranulatus]|nr:hypothetical protein NMY22_g16933 [Coprinellus aureogranulatus]